jgi:hypothetical protein
MDLSNGAKDRQNFHGGTGSVERDEESNCCAYLCTLSYILVVVVKP